MVFFYLAFYVYYQGQKIVFFYLALFDYYMVPFLAKSVKLLKTHRKMKCLTFDFDL